LNFKTLPFSKQLLAFIAIVIILVFAASVVAEEKPAPSSQPLRSAAERDYPPFSIVGTNDLADGFSVELFRATLAAMNRGGSFQTGSWSEVRGLLERGEIDALPLVGRTPEREEIFDFTFPYMSLHGAIVVRQETRGIRTLADLRRRRVAVMKGDNAEEFLRREERGIDITTTPTFENALEELSEGRHDAVVMQRLVALRLLRETGIVNLQVVDTPIEGFRQDFCFAVQEGDRQTLAMLNEGLALVMADGTYRRLHAKWFAAMQLPADRAIIVGGDHNFPPFEYLDDNGRPTGFTVELTQAIAKEMNMAVQIRLGPWAEILGGLRSGEVDAIQGMFYSSERERDFDFSPSYLISNYVGVTRSGNGRPPESFADLQGKSIVVQRGDVALDVLTAHGLGDQATVVETQEDLLHAVREGDYDCALAPRVSSLYLIDQNGWTNLVVGRHSFLAGKYSYAVPNGNSALLAQFSEGLTILKANGEYRRIQEKWMGLYDKTSPNFFAILRNLAIVAVPLLVLLLVFALWSWSLRRQVAVKTRELQESTDRFKYIFEAANVGKSLTLPTGEMNVNRAFADMLGYDPDELKGKQWQAFTPSEDIETTEKVIAPLLAGTKNAARFEKRYMHRSGTLIWADVSAVVRRDSCNKPIYFVTTVVDITEKKSAEEALQGSESRFRLFAELAPVGIVISDNQEKTLFASAKFTELFGYTLEDMPSVNEWWLLAYPEETFRDRVRGEWKAAIEEAERSHTESKPMEYPVRCKDGSVRQVEFRMATTGTLNVVVFADITARKRAEEEQEKLQSQLIQAQKMETVGRLAGGVAHDYNNMLTVIMGFTELALGKPVVDNQLEDDLRQVLEAARRAADITRQLLAFARKQTIAPQVLDLNDIIDGMVKMLRRLIGEHIDFSWQPGRGLGSVNIDPSQLDQLLANLCVNARDAIADVGKITIETSNVVFDENYCADHNGFVPGDFVLLAISDDGCGIDRATLDKLFEPFFTTKGTGKGTGLGLATVYGIVKQNKGFINVYSEPEKGSTFRIYLPRYVGATDRLEAIAPADSPQGHGEIVLIVEDEAAILRMAGKMLKAQNYTVLEASSPKRAMELAKEHRHEIHLLVTDVVMPEMNGRDLADELLALNPGSKVLFMSGYTADVIAHHGILDAGVNFLQKPFSRGDLAVKVRDALAS